VPTFNVGLSRGARPDVIAPWIVTKLDNEGHASVRLIGSKARHAAAALIACEIAAPLRVDDLTGATRPYHQIVRQTDRDASTSRSQPCVFAIRVSRFTTDAGFGSASMVIEEPNGGRTYLYGFPDPV